MSLFVFIFFWGGLGPNFSKDAVPDASDRKRKVRPGRGVDAYGRQVPGGAEGGAVDLEDGEVAGMSGTEMEVTRLKWNYSLPKDPITETEDGHSHDESVIEPPNHHVTMGLDP